MLDSSDTGLLIVTGSENELEAEIPSEEEMDEQARRLVLRQQVRTLDKFDGIHVPGMLVSLRAVASEAPEVAVAA